MPFLTDTECHEWWSRRALYLSAELDSDKSDPAFFALGEKHPAHTIYALARRLVNWASPSPPTDILVWVRETQIWHGNENLHLYYTWRRSRGSYDTVESHPGHLFHYFEIEDTISVLHLSLLFGWGVSLAADSSSSASTSITTPSAACWHSAETNWPDVLKQLMLATLAPSESSAEQAQMTSRHAQSPLALIAFAVAILFALSQAALPNGNLDIDLVTMFANGIAVAVYAPVIRSRGPIPFRLPTCIVMGALGITHFAWLIVTSALLSWASPHSASSASTTENAAMFIATGLVFSAVIILDLRTLQSAAIMLIATAASTVLELTESYWRSPAAAFRPHAIGLPAAPLHIGIALTLFLAARREQRKHRPGFCPACNYDLRGLSSGAACPECGNVSRQRDDVIHGAADA